MGQHPARAGELGNPAAWGETTAPRTLAPLLTGWSSMEVTWDRSSAICPVAAPDSTTSRNRRVKPGEERGGAGTGRGVAAIDRAADPVPVTACRPLAYRRILRV